MCPRMCLGMYVLGMYAPWVTMNPGNICALDDEGKADGFAVVVVNAVAFW